MAEETQGQEERIKRYLQWATVLVLVAVAVTAIDLTIKQGILRAINDAGKATGRIGENVGQQSTVPIRVADDLAVERHIPVDKLARNQPDGHPYANERISRTPMPEDSETDQPSSNELRIDGGPDNG